MRIEDMGQPINRSEEYMYALNIRLDAVIHQLSSIVDHLAKRDGVATTESVVVQKPVTRAKR